jgi:hypothetical protein
MDDLYGFIHVDDDNLAIIAGPEKLAREQVAHTHLGYLQRIATVRYPALL